MDEKNRLGLLFTGTGAVAGILSAFLTNPVPLPLVLIIAFGIYYGTSYITPYINVDMETYGGRRKILQTGVFSFLQGWLVLWFLVFEVAGLYS